MKNGNYELTVAPTNYPGHKYREKYIQVHHLVWWENTGEVVPKGCVLHHKNHNRNDNSFGNLKVMTVPEHASYHTKKRGRKWVDLVCPNCKVEFSRPRNKTNLQNQHTNTFCSRSCSSYYNNNKPFKGNIVREYRLG